MLRISLTEEQLKSLENGEGAVDVIGPDGQPLGSLTLFTAAERELIERHRKERGKRGRGVPGERVQAFLQKLHEMADQGTLDEATVQDLLRRTSAGELL